MPFHIKHVAAATIEREFHYDPATGDLSRLGYGGRRTGPVYVDYNYGKPFFVLGRRRFYVLGLIAWFLWGEHVPTNRVHIVDGNPLNLKASNYRRLGDTDKYCPKCKKFYQGPPSSADKHYRRRCAACKKNSARNRTMTLKKYGLTQEDYDNLLQTQQGGCQICGGADPGKALAVDHCHTGGHVRGLLCSLCNTGLGAFKDNPRLLLEAAKYLIRQQG